MRILDGNGEAATDLEFGGFVEECLLLPGKLEPTDPHTPLKRFRAPMRHADHGIKPLVVHIKIVIGPTDRIRRNQGCEGAIVPRHAKIGEAGQFERGGRFGHRPLESIGFSAVVQPLDKSLEHVVHGTMRFQRETRVQMD